MGFFPPLITIITSKPHISFYFKGIHVTDAHRVVQKSLMEGKLSIWCSGFFSNKISKLITVTKILWRQLHASSCGRRCSGQMRSKLSFLANMKTICGKPTLHIMLNIPGIQCFSSAETGTLMRTDGQTDGAKYRVILEGKPIRDCFVKSSTNKVLPTISLTYKVSTQVAE